MKPIAQLSRRETEVVSLLVLGLRDGEIASRLGIATSTVRMFLQRAQWKSQTRCRVTLAVWAARLSPELWTQDRDHDRAKKRGKLRP